MHDSRSDVALPADLEVELVELTDALGDGLRAAFDRHGLELVRVDQSLRLDFTASRSDARHTETA